MKPSWLVLALTLIACPLLRGQQVTVGAGYGFADYKEQADFLHFSGGGPTAMVSVERGRVALRVDASHLSMDPRQGSGPLLESFTMDQVSLRVGYRAMSIVGLEVGYTRRSVDPSRAAESFSAATLGVRAAYPLAPGAEVAVRTAYVAGTDFTGGGSAPFGIELGLRAAYGPGAGRFRFTGDYEFQRIDRRTDQDGSRLSVPIQSSLARLGVSVRF
jgi:hypothetical protein